jgi:Iron-containing redox enzyme
MTAPSHSQLLRTKMRLAEPYLLAVSNRFWRHTRLPEMFPEFLFMMHSIIRSSVTLINAAADAAERRANSDEVGRKIAEYYRRHAIEEEHHDEWLLDDLVGMGADKAEVLGRTPSPAVASLVGAQYYWALHVHPVALFGYLAVLEGNPSSVKELEKIRAAHGVPSKGMRTMVKHARLDPHHRDEMFEAFDALPLTEKQAELVAVSAFHTIEHLTQAFQEILDSLPARRITKEKFAQAV